MNTQTPKIKYKNLKGDVVELDLSKVIDATDMWTIGGKTKVLGLVGIQKIAEHVGLVEKKFTTDITPNINIAITDTVLLNRY